MSLISDALKRTQQHTGTMPPRPLPKHPPATPRAASHMMPAAAMEKTRHTLYYLFVALLVALFLGVIGGGVAYWMLRQPFRERAQTLEEVMAAPTKPADPLPVPVEKAVREVEAVTMPVQPPPPPTPLPEPPKSLPAPVITTSASAPMPPEPKPMPKLVLQAVTIHGGLREAMINGQILGVGGEIEGAKLVSIEETKVKLTFDGREMTLSLY